MVKVTVSSVDQMRKRSKVLGTDLVLDHDKCLPELDHTSSRIVADVSRRRLISGYGLATREGGPSLQQVSLAVAQRNKSNCCVNIKFFFLICK